MATNRTIGRRAGVALWVVQGLLAALFLFAGVMKLILPIEAMQGPIALPGWFIRFLGLAEIAGALGLILPGALRVARAMTPLAATGLVTIMAGAVVLTWEGGMGVAALIPLVVGVLAAAVVVGRRDWAGRSATAG
jgi:hypothetical protein